MRSSDDVLAAARYIWENPLRKGLVRDAADYRYSGSFEWPDALATGPEGPGLHSELIL
jgi:hypothetical protein